jgi:hypothetical protein
VVVVVWRWWWWWWAPLSKAPIGRDSAVGGCGEGEGRGGVCGGLEFVCNCGGTRENNFLAPLVHFLRANFVSK